MNIEIKPAQTEHAELALQYYSCLLSEKLPFILDNPIPSLDDEIKFIQQHDGEHAILFMAMHDNQVVGLSGYQIKTHHQLSHTCSLGISIDKEFRGKGIGSKLISAGENWCRSKSIHRLELEVLEDNPAITFYHKLGFEKDGSKRDAIKVNGAFKDMIIMSKILV